MCLLRACPGPSTMLSGQLSLMSRNGEGLFIKFVFFCRLSEAHAERLQAETGYRNEGSVGHHKEDPHWYWGGVGRTAPEEVMF